MQCGFGTILNDSCDNLIYTSNTGSVEIEKHTEEEQELIIWRTGLKNTENMYIWYHHQKIIQGEIRTENPRHTNPLLYH